MYPLGFYCFVILCYCNVSLCYLFFSLSPGLFLYIYIFCISVTVHDVKKIVVVRPQNIHEPLFNKVTYWNEALLWHWRHLSNPGMGEDSLQTWHLASIFSFARLFARIDKRLFIGQSSTKIVTITFRFG